MQVNNRNSGWDGYKNQMLGFLFLFGEKKRKKKTEIGINKDDNDG